MAENEDRQFAQRLKHAVARGDTVTARRLLKGGTKMNVKLWYDGTLLHDAVASGQPEIVQLLLKAGASVNERTKDGRTCLHSACRLGHKEVISRLIQAKANVSAFTKDGRSCLHIVLWRGYPDIAMQLINAGTSVNKKDEDGWIALHWAAKQNYFEVAELLLEKHSWVDAPAKTGRTPLHECVDAKADVRFLQLLVRHGADVNSKQKVGTTLQLAIQKKEFNSNQLMKLLIDIGYLLHKDSWLCSVTQSNTSIPRWLRERQNTVPSLMHICRLRIRKRLLYCQAGKSILRATKRLPLPPVLIDCLTFTQEFTDL